MKDLAPTIIRQRLVIEGYPKSAIDDQKIKDYLAELAIVTKMNRLIEPVTHRSDKFGWAGWTHWETSGAHFYAWEKPILFFSVDIYTCKAFSPQDAVDFTSKFLDASEVVFKEF